MEIALKGQALRGLSRKEIIKTVAINIVGQIKIIKTALVITPGHQQNNK